MQEFDTLVRSFMSIVIYSVMSHGHKGFVVLECLSSSFLFHTDIIIIICLSIYYYLFIMKSYKKCTNKE